MNLFPSKRIMSEFFGIHWRCNLYLFPMYEVWNKSVHGAQFCFFQLNLSQGRQQSITKYSLITDFRSWKPIFEFKIRGFSEKEWLKKQKIADLGFCFEFQVVVAVVGFKWRSWGNAKMADLRSRNAFKSLPQRNSLISIFNGFGFYFSILHRLWICHATLMI